jgi:menaquinone-dependent protoporphyrinogen IX oxidase
MLSLLVAFTTYDGYTAAIAKRIASTLQHADCAVEVCDLARSQPGRPIEDYDGVIAGGLVVRRKRGTSKMRLGV